MVYWQNLTLYGVCLMVLFSGVAVLAGGKTEESVSAEGWGYCRGRLLGVFFTVVVVHLVMNNRFV